MKDYAVNVDQALKPFDQSTYLAIGAILREDFIELSQTIEMMAYQDLVRDMRRLRLNDIRAEVKYDETETLRRLNKTRFRTRTGELTNAANNTGRTEAAISRQPD